jgi:signal transduction histidine kinase
VGQVLTALRMELGRIERGRSPQDTRVGLALGEAKQLVDKMFRTVRDLALGLRPSMLDDLGLRAALEWHVRDVSRRSGVDVELTIEGQVDSLPDRYQTCVYRAIQEALTNCVRHAKATTVAVRLTAADRRLDISVKDDGVGFEPRAHRDGLGLRGIEERVREIGGVLTIGASPGIGTALSMRLPLPEPVTEERLAPVAG